MVGCGSAAPDGTQLTVLFFNLDNILLRDIFDETGVSMMQRSNYSLNFQTHPGYWL